MHKKDIKEFGHILLHPNEGFEELSYHKRGSPLLATIVIACFFLFTMFERFALAFRFNHYSVENENLFLVFISTVCLTCMGVIANWALSTLWDGKATLRTIWIVAGYALAPYVASLLLRTLLSHLFTLEESAFLSIVSGVGVLWSLLVLWFGMLQTQEYTIGKNLICLIGTVIGMLLILFLCFLILLLFQQLFSFIASIFDEIVLRLSV